MASTHRIALIVVCTSVLAGCSLIAPVRGQRELDEPRSAKAPSTAAAVRRPPACRYREFPDGAIGADPSCTPGALNPAAVANPENTICRQAYERELAESEVADQALKAEMMIRYGSAGNPSTYVVAQRVPAADGGGPADPRNLWPMPRYGWGGALTESAVANALHDQICNRRVTVPEAARLLEGDWLSLGIPDED